MKIAATTLIGGSLSATVQAGEKQDSFRTAWLIEPASLPSAELSVAPGTLVLKQRLLPLGLAELDEDYRGSKPDDILPAGTELIRTMGSAKPVYCALRAKTLLLSALLSSLPNKTMRCFVDDNEDGRFDRDMMGYSNTQELPHPIGFLPKSSVSTVSLRYSARNAMQFSGSYTVGIKYSGQAKIGTLRRFQTIYGTEGR